MISRHVVSQLTKYAVATHNIFSGNVTVIICILFIFIFFHFVYFIFTLLFASVLNFLLITCY